MDKAKMKRIVLCTEKIYFIGQQLRGINSEHDRIDYNQKLKEVLERGRINAKNQRRDKDE